MDELRAAISEQAAEIERLRAEVKWLRMALRDIAANADPAKGEPADVRFIGKWAGHALSYQERATEV